MAVRAATRSAAGAAAAAGRPERRVPDEPMAAPVGSDAPPVQTR
jgi:hypothetical protein